MKIKFYIQTTAKHWLRGNCIVIKEKIFKIPQDISEKDFEDLKAEIDELMERLEKNETSPFSVSIVGHCVAYQDVCGVECDFDIRPKFDERGGQRTVPVRFGKAVQTVPEIDEE